MGYKCTYTAISDVVPREDVWHNPEGGRERAESVMHQFFGEGYAYAKAGSTEHTYPPGTGVWVGTWGDTIVFSAEPDLLVETTWELPPGFGRWDLNIHSVVDLCQFDVRGGPHGDRSVALFPDMETSFEQAQSGRPLPFEEPYLSGRHSLDDPDEDPEDAYPLPFHPLDFGNAAVLWMFGFTGETPPADEVMTPLIEEGGDRFDFPMHYFEPSTVGSEKKSLWSRLLGRP